VAQVTEQYFEHCRPKALGKQAEDAEARARLWALTESITGLRFSGAR
jgi:phosphopantetheinyl transferase